MSNPEKTTSENENEFVIFLIGEQEYCIDIMSLREIRGATTPTALPDSPPYVKGVINLRGAVVPIIDLATRLSGDKPRNNPTDACCASARWKPICKRSRRTE